MQYAADHAHTTGGVYAPKKMRIGTMEAQPDRQQNYRDWIEMARERVGKSRSAFFAEAGLDKSSVSRAFNEKLSVHIKEQTIDQLSLHWGIAPPDMRKSHSNGRLFGLAEPEIVMLSEPPEEIDLSEDPNLSVWEIRGRALELAGCVPGDMATVNQGIEPRNGDIVIAQIYDVNHGTAETVIRRFHTGRLPYLIMATADPALLMREPDYVDNERVKVMGTVVEVRRLRAP